ncbi:MAG: lipid-A-disaccharide synthase [Elusimicrobia bacterium]|nr:lipid-A-disaccharide synthase [Elusimicrobiota bacterium]
MANLFGRSPTILVVAGEESGDMRAASLVEEIKRSSPGIRFIGVGGERLRRAGVETFADINQLAVIGFTEVIKHFPRIKTVFALCVKKIRDEKPDAVLLVDYPGFNLRLAKKAKALGTKVLYYVSPQVWAWKEYRLKTIKRVVDRMMVLFPFEKEYYAKKNFRADFVGHPLLDELKPTRSREETLKDLGLLTEKTTLALLPGSRRNEIDRILPEMAGAVRLLKKSAPHLQIVLLKARNLPREMFLKHLTPNDGITITENYTNTLNICDLAIVASGTATLETAVLQKPLVVVYKTSALSAFLIRLLLRIPFVSLVNIISGRKIVEELLQKDCTAERIAKETARILEDAAYRDTMKRDLKTLRDLLGETGASRRAAVVVLEELKK